MAADPPPLTPISFHILLSLADGPLHGYGIMQRLRGAGVRVGPGTIYGALYRMQESGWIEEAQAERARGPSGQRQRYALTPAGQDALRADARRVIRAADLLRTHSILRDDLT